jgi:long-subunit fatty acid transport protein
MLSAGAQYDPTPTPDFSRSTRVPDGNRWLIGLGARHPIGSNGEIEVSADYLTFRESHVYRDDLLFAGTAAATPVSLRGTVKADALLLGVGLRWGF